MILFKNQWEKFLQKCVSTLERRDAEYKLVICGPAAVANSVAFSVSMLLPSFFNKFISYQQISPTLPACGANKAAGSSFSARSSVSGQSNDSEFLETNALKCACGRFQHQIRPLASNIQVISAPLAQVSKDILYDLLVSGWAVADLCAQRVFYLPARHEKRYFMKYLKEVDAGDAGGAILPARRRESLFSYFELRRCEKMAKNELRSEVLTAAGTSAAPVTARPSRNGAKFTF